MKVFTNPEEESNARMMISAAVRSGNGEAAWHFVENPYNLRRDSAPFGDRDIARAKSTSRNGGLYAIRKIFAVAEEMTEPVISMTIGGYSCDVQEIPAKVASQ
ncbi:unnamed protein product [Gongylonema pulchrum]|uniref:ANK_REP_REGION domain-containing protein n=1 Tax=Gongylonema pulchrum TaxID=637853 RepID=A0A183D557_9BILA|nr:unnamed protein product [Gongylonema pulchrum]